MLIGLAKGVYSAETVDLRPVEQLSSRSDRAQPSQSISDLGGQKLIGFGSDSLWRILPGFEFKTRYDSNINREPPHMRNEDLIFNYVPTIDLVRSGTRLEVRSGYEMKFQEYFKNPKFNAFNHVLKSSVLYKGHRLQGKLKEDLGLIKSYASSEQLERRTILFGELRPELIYKLTPKFSVSAIYHNYLFMYKDSILHDSSYDMNSTGGRIYYHISPKLDLFVEGSRDKTNYFNTEGRDSSGYTVSVGSIGRFTRKLIGTLQVGFKRSTFDSSSDDFTATSFNNWVTEAAFRYKLSPKVDLTLIAKRDRQESVYAGSGWYQSDMVGFLIHYRMTKRISFQAGTNLQRNKYPIETMEGNRIKKRRDWVVDSDVGFKWQPMRNFSVSMEYGFRERFSNFDNVFDYMDHTVDISVGYKFS